MWLKIFRCKTFYVNIRCCCFYSPKTQTSGSVLGSKIISIQIFCLLISSSRINYKTTLLCTFYIKKMIFGPKNIYSNKDYQSKKYFFVQKQFIFKNQFCLKKFKKKSLGSRRRFLVYQKVSLLNVIRVLKKF